jgi:diguanylate cyclase (GGDEF)-like protein/PAS domain S-box-containing protein
MLVTRALICPPMARPMRGAPDALYRHYVGVAQVATALLLVTVPLVIIFGHLPTSWPVVGVALAMAAGAALAARVTSWQSLAERRSGQLFLYAWSLIDVGAIAAGVAVTGGGQSWLWVVFVFTTIFFSVGYPLKGQLLLLGATVSAFMAAVIVGGRIDSANLLWKTAILIGVFVLASFPSAELRRRTLEQQQAREEADRLALVLSEREAWWRSLIERTSDPIVVLDGTWRIVFASPALKELLGWDWEQLNVEGITSVVHPDDVDVVRGLTERLARGSHSLRAPCRLRRTDGTWRDVELSVTDIGTRGEGRVVATLHDITERVAAEGALSHQATHDALTDLANRTAFYDSLRRSLALNLAEGSHLSVLMLDLEGFKEINHRFGHAVGDGLLVEAARRIEAALPSADVVARLGADEFGAVLTRAPGVDPSRAAHVVLRALVVVAGRPYWLRASAGLAFAPADGTVAEELVQRADRAMSEAKRTGTGVVAFHPDMAASALSHAGMLGELRRAIDGEELTLYYQPKVSLATGEVIGVEALVRWIHPQLGVIGPSTFLPVAEASGLVKALTAWVVPTALHQLHGWLAAGWDLSLSVNLSAQDLADEAFPARVASWLEDARVPASRLMLELTEASAINDHERGAGALKELRAKGLGISLDDFGSGYSSLAYLAELPLDEVKLDRGFLTGADGFLLRSVIAIGHHLGLRVVAEGVEDARTKGELADLGCDAVQGYVCARPLPGDELIALLDRWPLIQGAAPPSDRQAGHITNVTA